MSAPPQFAKEVDFVQVTQEKAKSIRVKISYTPQYLHWRANGSVSDDFIISDTYLKQAYSSFALLCYANSAVKSRLRGKTCKGEKTISIYSIPSHGAYLLSA